MGSLKVIGNIIIRLSKYITSYLPFVENMRLPCTICKILRQNGRKSPT